MGTREIAPAASAVREQVERVLSHRSFFRADALGRLLRFTVDEALAGRRDNLREYVIADRVFSRHDFDPSTDSIVRAQATRLRQRLKDYYETEGRGDPVAIAFHRGTYVPTFTWKSGAGEESASVPSLAIMPLLNLTGDAKLDYLADGLTDQIIGSLCRRRGLRVVARTSVFALRGRPMTIRDIATELDATFVVEGSVRGGADRYEIGWQLIDSGSGFHLASDTMSVEARELFAIEDRIAASIVKRVPQADAAAEAPPRRPPSDMQAHHLFLRGMHQFHRLTPDSFKKAVEAFEQAMAIDPGYAPPMAGLANLLNGLAWIGQLPAAAALPKSRALTDRALALEPESAEALCSDGFLQIVASGDLTAGLGQIERAIETTPGNVDALILRTYMLLAAGQPDEAIQTISGACERDPLSLVMNMNLGVAYYLAHRFDEAMDAYRSTLDLDPDFAECVSLLGLSHLAKGEHAKAIELIERGTNLLGPTMNQEYLAAAYGATGRMGEAEEALRRLLSIAESTYIAPHRMALAFIGVGDHERALEWMERAYESGDPRLMWMNLIPLYDPIRDDPRFRAIAKHVLLAS